MGNVLFLAVIGGLIVVMGWIVLSQEGPIGTPEDPEKIKESLVTETITEDMAQYNLGIDYSFDWLSSTANVMREDDGSYTNLCTNGKINRAHQGIANGMNYIVCGPDKPECGYTPYIYRKLADERCYASKGAYAISATMYNEEGILMPYCIDSTVSYYKLQKLPGVADPRTLRCSRP